MEDGEKIHKVNKVRLDLLENCIKKCGQEVNIIFCTGIQIINVPGELQIFSSCTDRSKRRAREDTSV